MLQFVTQIGVALSLLCVADSQPPVVQQCKRRLQLSPGARVALAVEDRYLLFAMQSDYYSPGAGGVDVLDVQTGKWWPTTNMSSGRTNVAVTAWGPLAIFAGGTSARGLPKSDAVDVLNTTSGSWRHYKMSIGRDLLAAVSCGPYTLFAGGSAPEVNQSETDEVDIWNHDSGAWLRAKLSQPRKKPEAVCVGSKVIIAGGEIAKTPPSETSQRDTDQTSPTRLGDYTAVVDIFDTISEKWSTSRLGQARQYFGIARATPNLAVVAGGFYNDIRLGSVEMYAATTGTWQHAAGLLSHNRSNLDAANAIDRYSIFGSGNIDASAKVALDFFDGETGGWTGATSNEAGNPNVAAVKNVAFFSYPDGNVSMWTINPQIHGNGCSISEIS